MRDARYQTSFTRAALLPLESLRIAELYVELGDWEKVREAVIQNNLLQARTENTLAKIYQELAARAVETAMELPAKDQAKAVAWLADEARTMPGALRHIDELGPHALRAYSSHGLETGRMIGRYGDVGARAMDALSPRQLADLNAHAMKDLLKLPVEKQHGFLLNVQKHPEVMAQMSVSLGKHEAELAKHGLTVAAALAGTVVLTQTEGGRIVVEDGKEIIVHGIDGAVEIIEIGGKTVRGPLNIIAIVIGLVAAIFLLFKISPFLPKRRKPST